MTSGQLIINITRFAYNLELVSVTRPMSTATGLGWVDHAWENSAEYTSNRKSITDKISRK